MLVCSNCRVEMKCETNGVMIRFNSRGDHVYSGDEFKCPACGLQVVTTDSAQPWQDQNPPAFPEVGGRNRYNIWMGQ